MFISTPASPTIIRRKFLGNDCKLIKDENGPFNQGLLASFNLQIIEAILFRRGDEGASSTYRDLLTPESQQYDFSHKS